MPRRPRKPCLYPGCPELIEYPERYCEKHQHAEKQRHQEYQRLRNDKAEQEFYGSLRWKRLRQMKLRREPLCERCGSIAEMVHHRVEIKKDWSQRLDMNNLISLCHKCHQKEHRSGGNMR